MILSTRSQLPHVLFGLLAFLIVFAGQVPAADKSEPSPFVLTLADGTTATGPLVDVSAGWSVRLGGTTPRQVDGADVIALRRAQPARPPWPQGEQVVFANGDRLPAKVVKLAGERLRIRARFGAEVELVVPLSALSVIWITAPDHEDHPDRLLRRVAAGRRQKDTVLLRNGDLLEGLLTGLDGETGLRIDVNKKAVTVALDKVAAIALNTELVRSLRPRGVYARLVLANGCRLSLASARTADGALVGKTLFGIEARVPLEQVIALDLCQGRTVYLSDLKPARYEFTSYTGGLRFPIVADGSVGGHDLRLGGQTYEKGLGMHSASRLTYDLKGGYRRFEAVVGLDDQEGLDGSVRVQVLVDGKPRDLGWDHELTHRNGPKAIRVNVEGAGELTLVVDFGRHADIGDHVDWADARLIK
jgi:hypothetical protein